MVGDDQQRSLRFDRCGEPPEERVALRICEVDEVRGDEVVRARRRFPRQNVRAKPFDPRCDVVADDCCLRAAALERNARDVGRRDAPTALRQPDRIGTFAATDVERGAGRELRNFGDQLRVGLARPQRIGGTVSLVPKAGVSARRSMLMRGVPFAALPDLPHGLTHRASYDSVLVIEQIGYGTLMDAHRLDATFFALADPTRRAILGRLASGEASVAELTEPFGISQPAISRHLKVLEKAGLIRRSRDAQRRPCRLEPKAMMEANAWIEHYRELWERAYQRLDVLLADEMKATGAPPKPRARRARKK